MLIWIQNKKMQITWFGLMLLLIYNQKTKKKQKKCDFRKSSKKFYIDINKRLYQTRTIISLFEGQQYIINSLILLEIEIEPIVNLFHIKLGHLGINVLMYEIERRGLYINKKL